ncbi:MAG TPA: Ig-like domain-containing protein, partial [Candidatus Rifleibacterium sp.]|nr:Ig-like domain-containing protein [Candidatus Rifleibacterium sp.]
MFIKKNFFQVVLISFCLILGISYILGCGGSSGGTTSNPMGIGQNNVLSGRILVSQDIALSVVNAGERLSIKADVSSGKKPVKDCEVWLENYPETRDRTDDSGLYSLENVAPGKQRVVAKYSTGAGEPVFKMISEPVEVGENKGLPKADDIELKPAKNSVSGVLRDSEGKPLPFGTICTLWGEQFTVGADGRFDSPALPEGFTREDIKVSATANTEPITISAPFITDQAAPMQIEIFMPEKGGNGNNSPVVFLTARKGGVPSSKVGMGQELTLIAEAFDPDPADANRLFVEWDAAKGTLATNSANPFQAIWTAPDHPGMAAIYIKIFDSQGAWSSAKLMILVGLDQVPPATPIDVSPPKLLSMVPASASVNVPASATITLNFDENLASASINTTTFLVSSGTSPIAVALSISPDTRSVVLKPINGWPLDADIFITVTGLKDMSLNVLSGLSCYFSTVSAASLIPPDTTPPGILSGGFFPPENALNVPTGTAITVYFTEPIDASTINTSTFTVAGGSNRIGGFVTLSGDGLTATFTPTLPLPYASLITVTIASDVRDLASN